MKPRSVPAAKFKNSCLKLLEQVRKDGIPITVTRHGKPVVRIVPVSREARRRTLRGTIAYQARNIFSTGESWEAES